MNAKNTFGSAASVAANITAQAPAKASIFDYTCRSVISGVALGVVAAIALASPAVADDSLAICGPSESPIELSFWAWDPAAPVVAELWNELHPNVQIIHSDMPVGNAGGYQKMFNAAKAGAAPDIGFIEFDNIAAFRSQGIIQDVSAYVTDAEKADFLEPLMKLSQMGTPGAMYNVPMGSGPMALFYRKDLFEEHGIEVPGTWAEFEAAAQRVTEIDPEAKLVNFDGYGNANWFAGLASQNGAQWFEFDDGGWRVTVNDAATKETAALWQRMISSGAAGEEATFSPAWSAAMASGQIWTWPSAVWGVGVISSVAPETAGNWAVAPLPTWNEGDQISAIWGGGGMSVFEGSAHPCEAARFITWLGTDAGALKILNEMIGIYPTTNTLLDSQIFDEGVEFFGGQKIFDIFKDASAQTPDFTWGPSMTGTYNSITDAFSAARASETSLADALDIAQDSVVSSMERDGFTLSK